MSMLARFAATGAGAGALPTPTFVSSSTNRVSALSNTVTAPTGIQNGDLLIALTYMGTSATVTPPAGFSQIYADYGSNPFFSVNIKTAASESGNYTFTASVSTDFTVVMLVYRNATRVNTLGGINRTSSASATGVSITPTFRGTLLAAFSRNTTGSLSSTPSGFTLRAGPGTNPPYTRVYEKTPQAATATGDQSLVYTTTGAHSGIQLQITNEPTVAPEFVASEFAQNTSGTTTQVVNKPAGTVEGDLMIAIMARNGDTTWTGDNNWTEVADQTTIPSLRVAYKVAGANEPSSYTFTMGSSSDKKSACILTYRYAAYDTVGSFTTGTNPLILPSISPSESQSILIAAGARDAPSITLGTPTGMTARVTDAASKEPSFVVCDQTVAKGPTGTRSMSTGSTNNVAGIMLAIKPTRSLT